MFVNQHGVGPRYLRGNVLNRGGGICQWGKCSTLHRSSVQRACDAVGFLCGRADGSPVTAQPAGHRRLSPAVKHSLCVTIRDPPSGDSEHVEKLERTGRPSSEIELYEAEHFFIAR